MAYKWIIYIFTLTFALNSSELRGQILKDRPKGYQRVFVDTDNFEFSYLENLEKSLSRAIPDSVKYQMLNDLSYYWHTRDLNKSMDIVQQALELAKADKDGYWYGKLQITQGAVLLRREKLDSALQVLSEALLKVRKQDLPMLYTQVGYVYERKGQLDMAANYAEQCLDLGKQLNDKRAIAVAYSDISNLFWKQSKYEKGLEYGLKSLEVFEERGLNDLDYDFTLYVVANNYLALKDYETALQYYEQAMAIGERYGFYNNLSDIYISLVDLYGFLQRFEKASHAGEKAIYYAQRLDNNFLLMRAWLSMGKLQYVQGDYKSAIASLLSSIEVATPSFGDLFYLSQTYETLGKAYAADNNYKEAYLSFAEYDKLKSQIFTAESDQRISLLQTEFEVEQKENTIQTQEGLLKKGKSVQMLISIIATLLLLLLTLTLIAIRNNRKKGRLLEKQNHEKEFLLKEIHHRVKNNLGVVSSLLALQSAKIKNKKMIDVLDESRNRVYSMSMIHQRLYQGKNLSTIEMKDYLIDLFAHILSAYGAEDRVQLNFDMDKLEVDIDTAIPLGLIVNELFTNILKHAFPNQSLGAVKVSLYRNKSNGLVFKIADNGVGQTESGSEQIGFGTQLIELLTIQLDGVIQKDVNNGTSLTFEFNSAH